MKKEFPFSEEEIKELHKKVLIISKTLDDFADEISSFGNDFDFISDFISQKTGFSPLEVLEVFEFQKKLKDFLKDNGGVTPAIIEN
jgi:hypothetical protein